MWEPDESIIHQLRSAYFDELPRQIALAGEDAERDVLTERRTKIGNLLERGYGEPLIQHGLDGLVRATLQQSGKRTSTTKAETHQLTARSRPPAQQTHISGLIKDTVNGPGNEVEPEEVRVKRRRASREEDRRAIERLRRECNVDIPTKLSGNITAAERKKLVARQSNIRDLLKHGYGVLA